MKEQITPETLEHKVKVRLAVLGISGSDLAELLGISPQGANSLLRLNARKPQKKTLLKITKLLGVPDSYLTKKEGWEGLFSPAPRAIVKLKERLDK